MELYNMIIMVNKTFITFHVRVILYGTDAFLLMFCWYFSRNTVTPVIEPSIAHALNLYENFEIYAW